MDPLIGLTFDKPSRRYLGGDAMHCEYQIDAVAADEIVAVEASVLWFTRGKGETDMGVHFFRRQTPADVDDGDLRPLGTMDLQLPTSPLSYDGVILKIHWCVRIRLFLTGGRDFVNEQEFCLGDIPPGQPVESSTNGDNEADDTVAEESMTSAKGQAE